MHSQITNAPAERAKIDFLASRADLRCVLLGMLGFSNQHISAETGLNGRQISYRLNLAKVKRADYRNGRSNAARAIQAQAEFEFGNFLAAVISRATGKRVTSRDGRLYIL